MVTQKGGKSKSLGVIGVISKFVGVLVGTTATTCKKTAELCHGASSHRNTLKARVDALESDLTTVQCELKKVGTVKKVVNPKKKQGGKGTKTKPKKSKSSSSSQVNSTPKADKEVEQ